MASLCFLRYHFENTGQERQTADADFSRARWLRITSLRNSSMDKTKLTKEQKERYEIMKEVPGDNLVKQLEIFKLARDKAYELQANDHSIRGITLHFFSKSVGYIDVPISVD